MPCYQSIANAVHELLLDDLLEPHVDSVEHFVGGIRYISMQSRIGVMVPRLNASYALKIRFRDIYDDLRLLARIAVDDGEDEVPCLVQITE